MMCAPDGGVLDDLVVYRQGEQEFLVIANASNTGVVLAQLARAGVPGMTLRSPTRPVITR